jgi:Clp protease
MTVQSVATRTGAPVLLLQGRIVPGDSKRLRAAFEADKRVTLLVLNSPGGSVLEAQEMAKSIRAFGAPVLVPGNAVCASACFMLFAAGRNRLAEPGAMIGVHSASVSGGNETMDTLGVTTLMAREAAAYGVPSGITGRMVTTRPGQMAWLTRAELESMGVRVIERQGASGGQVAPGSSRGAPSDWTRGFEQGRAAGENASCASPSDIGDKEDWRLGCESGRRSQTASVSSSRAPAKGVSDWSRGFDYGRARRGPADCSAPEQDVADPSDWARGCESGRKAGGG